MFENRLPVPTIRFSYSPSFFVILSATGSAPGAELVESKNPYDIARPLREETQLQLLKLILATGMLRLCLPGRERPGSLRSA